MNSIFKQALDRSPAYGSIKDVLQSFNTDQVERKIDFNIRDEVFLFEIHRKLLNNKKIC